MKKTFLSVIIFALVLVACSKEPNQPEIEENPVQEFFFFQDDFETENNDLAELIPSNGSRWTNIQHVDTESGPNEIMPSSDQVSLGNSSLFLHSKATIETLSKIDIEKFGFQAFEGSTLRFEADYYLDSDLNYENLFLFDLECCSCWDPEVPNNQCPGIRLKLGGDNDYLSIERGKISLETIGQAEYSFPKKQWVNVILEIVLSGGESGQNKLIIDGIEVINSSFANMPSQAIFGPLFEQEGIDFQFQEPIFYERFQIGATANPSSNDLDMYIDNVKLTIQ